MDNCAFVKWLKMPILKGFYVQKFVILRILYAWIPVCFGGVLRRVWYQIWGVRMGVFAYMPFVFAPKCRIRSSPMWLECCALPVYSRFAGHVCFASLGMTKYRTRLGHVGLLPFRRKRSRDISCAVPSCLTRDTLESVALLPPSV